MDEQDKELPGDGPRQPTGAALQGTNEQDARDEQPRGGLRPKSKAPTPLLQDQAAKQRKTAETPSENGT